MAADLSPARRAIVVLPGTSSLSPTGCRALYVGGAGDVNVVMEGGDTCLFSAVPAGSILPIRVDKVLSASTTATLIVALY